MAARSTIRTTPQLEWLAALRDTAVTELARPSRLAILGDFNVAPTDADVWDIAQFATATHVTAAERAALTRSRPQASSKVMFLEP